MEVQIRRCESLSIYAVDESGEDKKITFESEDEENITLYVGLKSVGLLDMENFLALCRRALELWEKEEATS